MTLPRIRLILAVVLGMLLQGLTGVRAAEDQVLAWVDGATISTVAFLAVAERKTPANGVQLTMDEKKEVMDGLIEDELLYAVALAKDLDTDPKVKKVMVNTLLRGEVYAGITNSDFSDAVLERYYDTHKSEFIVQPKVQIKRILLKVPDHPSDRAQATLAALVPKLRADPARFKDEAAEISEDPYRRRGGDVGFVSAEGKPGLDPRVVQVAFAMKEGDVSDPFLTNEGWNLLYVSATREAVTRTFEQMKGSVLRKVKNDAMIERYDAYVARIAPDAKVRVDVPALTALKVVPELSAPLLDDESYEEP